MASAAAEGLRLRLGLLLLLLLLLLPLLPAPLSSWGTAFLGSTVNAPEASPAEALKFPQKPGLNTSSAPSNALCRAAASPVSVASATQPEERRCSSPAASSELAVVLLAQGLLRAPVAGEADSRVRLMRALGGSHRATPLGAEGVATARARREALPAASQG